MPVLLSGSFQSENFAAVEILQTNILFEP